MKQLNVPKRLTATVQIWTSVLLLIIATCLSLTPIITLHTADNVDQINEMIRKIDLPGGEKLDEIPETVDVSAIKIVKSIGVMSKVMKSVMNAAKEKDADNLGDEIAEVFKTDEGKETLVIALSFATTVASNFNDENKSDSGLLANILSTIITVIALLALLVLTFVIPVMLLVTTLIALVTALLNLSAPEKVSANIARKLPAFISLPFSMMLFQCVVPGMSYGSGIVGICVVAILSAVLGLVISRLRTYEAPAFRYLNIVQGVSALGIVGFMVFFFNLLKTNVFTNFLHGKFATYVASVALVKKASASAVVNQSYLVDLALIMVYVVFALAAVSYLEKCVQRLACSVAANKKGGFIKDSCIVKAVLMLVIYILPTYVMGQKHYYTDPTSTAAEGEESFLVLNAEESSALKLVLVGIILMIVAEIALIVLKAVFCKGMNRSSISALVGGETVEATDEPTEETTEEATEEATEEVVEEAAEEVAEEAAAEAAEEVVEE